MKIAKSQKPNSFRAPLLEMVIIIGMFAVISIYLLRMFMVADRLRGRAEATTGSVTLCQSVAEYVKSLDSMDPEEICRQAAARFGGNAAGGRMEVPYDKQLNTVPEGKAGYRLILELSDGNGDVFGSVGVYDCTDTAEEGASFCRLSIYKGAH